MRSWRAAMVAVVVLAAGGKPARAAAPCDGPMGRSEVVACAVARSLEVTKERNELAVLAGRRVSAGLWLPANPVVSALVASRTATSGATRASSVNWYVTLSQEIEISGQRSKRLAVADADAAAQVRRVAVAEQQVAAQAARLYFTILGQKEILTLTSQFEEAARGLEDFAIGRLRESLISPVDASLLRAETIRMRLIRAESQRRLVEAQTALTALLGLDPARPIEVTGSLEVPAASRDLAALVDRALSLRGELLAAEADRKSIVAQLEVWRRSRAPNLTLSFTAQNDGFDERVFGAGVSLPIPLPAPVGRTYRGEILATTASIARSETTIEALKRQIRGDVTSAFRSVENRSATLALFPADLISAAPQQLIALRNGLTSRQVPIRESLFTQRALLDLLVSYIEARAAYAQAWVDLAYTAGLPLAGESP